MDDFDAAESGRIVSGAPRGLRQELQQEGNGPGHQEAYEYLCERGYVFAGDHWIAPVNPARKDVRAIVFLHLQWDYPKFVTPSPEIVPPRERRH